MDKLVSGNSRLYGHFDKECYILYINLNVQTIDQVIDAFSSKFWQRRTVVSANESRCFAAFPDSNLSGMPLIGSRKAIETFSDRDDVFFKWISAASIPAISSLSSSSVSPASTLSSPATDLSERKVMLQLLLKSRSLSFDWIWIKCITALNCKLGEGEMHFKFWMVSCGAISNHFQLIFRQSSGIVNSS